ncbi:MAG: hypothetical protein WBN31_00835 [Gammaproteobacteria bacterium]
MSKPDNDKGFFDRPENVTRLWRGFVAACVFVAALDLLGLLEFLYHRHSSFFVEGMPGFYAAWGFIGISLLIVLAKALRKLLMRPEDYYDGD